MTEGCAHCARREAELTEANALWESVGKHIDAACIGYNHTQIKAVFHLNGEQRKNIYALIVRAETAESKLAAISRQVAALEAEWRKRANNAASDAKDAKDNTAMLYGALAEQRAMNRCADALQTLKARR